MKTNEKKPMRYPIFVVNLAHQPRRYQFMVKQLTALGLEAIRIEAVNGKDPAARAHAAAASWAPLADSEIGCFESHRAIWRRIAEENLPGAFVLEDDTVVASDFSDLDFPDDLVARTDLVKIDEGIRGGGWYCTPELPLARGRRLRRLLGPEHSTAAYFVSRRGANRLLRMSRGYFEAVDNFMFGPQSKAFWSLDVLKLFPAAAMQYRFLQSGGELHDEVADSIQGNPGAGGELFRRLSPYQNVRIKIRRMLDNDTKAVRARRIREGHAAAERDGGLVQENVRFESPDMSHVERAAEIAFGKAG